MKKAFTLAEVLITLGIIGVVAAMTLPALVKSYKGRILQTQLKKSYSILSQALQKMQFDTGKISNNENYVSPVGSGTFMQEFKPYFLSFGNCGTRSCVEQSYEDESGTIQNETKKYRNYNNTTYVYAPLFDDGQMIISDGSFIMIENYRNNIYITVDVNGLNKKPNRWGHDLFTFQIDNKNGKLIPMGADGTDYLESRYCAINSVNNKNGISCTHKALTEKNYFKNLPK